MAIRLKFGRRTLPVGVPTLAQVQTLAAQAEAAAQGAAAEAVAAAQGQIAGDVAAAEAARGQAETLAAAVETGFYRRDFILTPTFAGGIGAWISTNRAAAVESHEAPRLVFTGTTDSTTNWPVVGEGVWSRIGDLKALLVSIRAAIEIVAPATSPGFRVALELSHNGSALAATVHGAILRPGAAFADHDIEVAIPAGYSFFRVMIQLVSSVTGNRFLFERISARNAALERAISVSRKTVSVANRAEILAASVGEADQVHDRETGLFLKRLPQGGSATDAPATMADGTVLIPAWNADPRMWGAVMDGQRTVSADNLTVTHTGTQSWSALIRCFRWAARNDRTALLPEGRFFATNLNESAWRDISGGGTQSLRIKGAGRDASQILWNDHRGLNGLGRLDFMRLFSMVDLHMEDCAILGDWRRAFVTPQQTILTGGHLIEMGFSGSATLVNVELSGAHYFALAASGGQHFEADRCKVHYALRDGLHANVSRSFVVTNSDFYRVFDDAIAGHVYEMPGAGKPHGVDYHVSGNRIEQAQGIALVGASRAKVHDNIGRQIHTRWIDVGHETQVSFSLDISSNYCEDIISQVQLSGLPAHGSVGGDSSNGITVGGVQGGWAANAEGNWDWESSGAGVVAPYARMQGFFPASGRPHAFGISVKDNQFVRTLEFGKPWAEQGRPAGIDLWTRVGPRNTVPLTPAMVCNGPAIAIAGPVVSAAVEGNRIFGSQQPVEIGFVDAAPAGLNRALNRVAVVGNEIANFRSHGLRVRGKGIVDVTGNTFDGDPLLEHPAHAVTGTWSSAAAAPAVSVAGDPALRPTINFRGNEVANVSAVASGRFPGAVGDNFVRGDFVGVDDPANKGVRNLVWHPNELGTLVYEGSDATDKAGFLVVRQVNARHQDAMPATGHWIAGTVVSLGAPLVRGAEVVTGYLRLTTGTGHVLGTDWAEIKTEA